MKNVPLIMRNFQNKQPSTKTKLSAKVHTKSANVVIKQTSETKQQAPVPPPPSEEPTPPPPAPKVRIPLAAQPIEDESSELTEEKIQEQIKIGTEMISKRIEAVITSSNDGLEVGEAFEAAKKDLGKSDKSSTRAAAAIRSMGYSCVKGQAVLIQKLKDANVDSAEAVQMFVQENPDLLTKKSPSERTQITRNSIMAAMKLVGAQNMSKADSVSVGVLKYVLCSMGERLDEQEFDALICDLDIDLTTGEIPIPSLLYLLNAQGGYPPGEDKKKQRRAQLRAARPTFARKPTLPVEPDK